MSPNRSARGVDEAPSVAVRDGIARVDLHADGVTDQEHLVCGLDLDLGGHRQAGSAPAYASWPSGQADDGSSDDPSSCEQPADDQALHFEYLQLSC